MVWKWLTSRLPCIRLASTTVVFCWIPSHVSIRGNDRAILQKIYCHFADYKYEISSKRTDTLPPQVLSVWMSGKIYGTVAGVINSMLFIPLLVGPSCSWGQAAGYQPRPQAGG